MRFLSTMLAATLASSLASASALPSVDQADPRVNLETKPALSARQLGLPFPTEGEDNGASCYSRRTCKSDFCKNGRCATNQCKTAADCGGGICSHNGKCIAGNLHDKQNCEQDEQCRSSKCGNGKCTPGIGYYSARCSSAYECYYGLICRQAPYLAPGERACLDPDTSGAGQDEGAPCEGNSDCKRGLECKDQSSALERIVGVFGGFRQQDPRDRFQCAKLPKEQCTGNKRLCFTDSECCSKNCKTSEIIFARQCEE